MEHKQHQEAVSSFELIAVPVGPDPADERLFVQAELERVVNLMKTHRKPGVLTRIVSTVDGPTIEDWRHYHNKLRSYANVIDRYEQAMYDGVVPFRIDVTNVGTQKDYHITIVVRVHDGEILLTRQQPTRPPRPEGHQHAMEMPSYNVFTGFSRSNVRVGKTTMAAEFSELAAGDEAALINQTLFLQMTPETTLTYELTAKHAGNLSGMVGL